MKANLVLTDSYFNIFPLLIERLRGTANDLKHRNFVFCEEKLSLMTERRLCEAFGGTFNTEVYSFGNFLRARKTVEKVLSKEGSAMVVKKILSEIPLKRFNHGKNNLAPSLFELISQLKSAKITPQATALAAENTDGILSAKLSDIAAVFSEYERYLENNGLSDQSSVLSYLPKIAETDAALRGARVFIVGFTGFTAQIRQVISAILKNAAEVTAVLTYGKNEFAFVNETAAGFLSVCLENGVTPCKTFVASDYSRGGAIIKDGLFNPLYKNGGEKPDAYFLAAKSVFAETERIAEVIKRKVIDGENRYRDFTVIVPDGDEYCEAVRKSFSRLNVPYFLDVKRKPENFPLVSLIYAYADAFYRGFKVPVLAAFFKNPFVCDDAEFTDGFENYLYKYDLCYGKFRKPFTFPTESKDPEELARYEDFRAFISGLLKDFDVYALLERLSVREKNQALTERLKNLGEAEDAEVNAQMFDKVTDLLREMKFILPAALDPLEFKNVFSSGVSAMEISVIPQYNDAVFVGNFRQAALAGAQYVFAAGLTDAVPSVSEDIALLSDGDIDALAELKVLIEPKINVVNKRRMEEAVLGLSVFTKGLYLSFPLADRSGGQTVKSEILIFAEKVFEHKPFPPYDGYLTADEGMRSFARDCNRFAGMRLKDFSVPSGFYVATGGAPEKIVRYANKETARIKLTRGSALPRGALSPTAIEDYYACPYRSFAAHVLKLRERDTGEMNAVSVGNLMHDIFKEYISRVEEAIDKETSDRLFSDISAKVLSKDEYARFDSGENAYGVKLALNECRKYCGKMAEWHRNTLFSADGKDLEVRFGDDDKCRYRAVPLLGGKVKLAGKIDRIDTYGDYFRIIDYKTGGSEVGDDKIFAGVKLQLYLYSLAVTDKTLAGAYYLRVNDEYASPDGKPAMLVEGKTAENFSESEKDFVPTGKNKSLSQSALNSVQKYVRAMAEQAARQMSDGVIVPSPFEKTCAYCKFSPLCRGGLNARTVHGADAELIERSVSEEESESGGAENGTR